MGGNLGATAAANFSTCDLKHALLHAKMVATEVLVAKAREGRLCLAPAEVSAAKDEASGAPIQTSALYPITNPVTRIVHVLHFFQSEFPNRAIIESLWVEFLQ